MNKLNLLHTLEILIDQAPVSGEWIIDRTMWQLTRQVVGLSADLRGAKTPAKWVEPQREALVRLIGSVMKIGNLHPMNVAKLIEGHIAYLEKSNPRAFTIADDQVAMLKACGASDAAIAEHVKKKTADAKAKVEIKQKGIKSGREILRSEVEQLMLVAPDLAYNELDELEGLSPSTQLYIVRGITTNMGQRVSWLMDRVMEWAGELLLVNTFMSSNYLEDCAGQLDREIEEIANGGVEEKNFEDDLNEDARQHRAEPCQVISPDLYED